MLASLLGLVSLAVTGAVLLLQGERMGTFVAKVLPEMRGKLEFRSIRWPARQTPHPVFRRWREVLRP